MMLPQEIIRHKRDNKILSKEEIDSFITGIVNEKIDLCQISAFTMAVYFNGMTTEERVYLTKAMTHSGRVLDWKAENIENPIVDKHSTGGVGDKVSLMLAPIVAACGGSVPMIAGRGLGHTGGTIDKLESIPGYQTSIPLDKFQKIVKKCGYSIIGQTIEIAPADRKIYAVRDITATVESLDLITASILSKKIAAGLETLVMDVKVGSGAFMADIEEARALANAICSVANAAGVKTSAIITNMDQVLGASAGNAIEIIETIKFLRNEDVDQDLYKVTEALAIEMLVKSGVMTSEKEAAQKIKQVIENGQAAEIFQKSSFEHGAPADLVDNYQSYLKLAPVCEPIFAQKEGFVSKMNVRNVGMDIIRLGGGRIVPNVAINHSVGFNKFVKIGQKVGPQDPIAFAYINDKAELEETKNTLCSAIEVCKQPEDVLEYSNIIEKVE